MFACRNYYLTHANLCLSVQIYVCIYVFLNMIKNYQI